MRWREGRWSTNVEDRRGVRLGGRPMIVGGGILGLLVIVIAPAGRPAAPLEGGYDRQADFVSVVPGDTDEVHQARQRVSEVDSNTMSVYLELSADCLAGVLAHHANIERETFEAGDLEACDTFASPDL